MKKRSLFVVDADKEFATLVNSLYPPDKMEVRFFSSAMKIFAPLKKETPVAIFLCLDTSDLNDFVMRDLLKKTNVDYSIPVYLTYSQQAEKDLEKYEKLKYKAEGYCKKPVSKEDLEAIMRKYAGTGAAAVEEDVPELEEVDADEFSDENIDRLVRGELVDFDEAAGAGVDVKASDPGGDSTNELKSSSTSEILSETKDELMVDDADDLGLDLDLDIDLETGMEEAEFPADAGDDGDVPVSEKPKPANKEEKAGKKEEERRVNKDLEVQLISLESQNEFLRTESKKLANTIKGLEKDIKGLKEDIEKKGEEYRQLKSQSEQKAQGLEAHGQQLEKQRSDLEQQLEASAEEKSGLSQKTKEQEGRIRQLEEEKATLQEQVTDVCNRLTDKERELVARNHEFEVDLKRKLDEVLQETEDRLLSEFRQREEKLNTEVNRLKNEKDKMEMGFRNEIERLTDETGQLEGEREELKKREDSLNRTISTLAEEKVVLSAKIESLEEGLSNLQQALKEKEAGHRETVENFNKELEQVRSQLDSYKKRMDQLAELLRQSLSLTQTGEQE